MVKFTWIKDSVPNNIKVRQVYGIVFSTEGNIILRVDDGKYKLTGGHPEVFDENFEDTLKREYIEELNIELEDIHYLGYLLVEENDERYAQVRMIAKIKKIGSIKPDSDNGKIYERFMTNIRNVKNYLNYSDIAGNQMMDDAISYAKESYNIEFSDNEYYI